MKMELQIILPAHTIPTGRTRFTVQLSARELFEALKIKKIYVRYFNKPRIDNYLRVTIGTDEEMDALLAFFRDYLKKKA